MSIIGILVWAFVGDAIGGVIGGILDEDSIKDEVAKNYEEAFKLLIKQKKKKAVKVGIFDEEDDLIENLEIKSEKGVSSSIHKGQVIYV